MLRPHISRIQPHTYDSLYDLRDNLLRNFNDRTVPFIYKNSQAIGRLVMLVYVSVNHILPTPVLVEEEE